MFIGYQNATNVKIVPSQYTTYTFNGFYRATLCVSAVFAAARCLSVCQVGVCCPHDWIYRQTSFSAR